jgi:Mg-chelatase subunit ChlD
VVLRGGIAPISICSVKLLCKEIDTAKTVYIVDTKPIDSVDVNKMIYDIFQNRNRRIPGKTKSICTCLRFAWKFRYKYGSSLFERYYKKLLDLLPRSSWREKIKRDAAIDTFTVREYGANDSIPYNIVLTVDYSGSMSPVMKAIFEGTELFVRLKSKYDKIALTSYNQKYSVKVPFAKDTTEIISLYRMKRAEGIGLFSAMYDAVFNSIDLFRETEPEIPRVLVLFSDGDDNYSKKEIGEIIDSAKSQNVHIFTVAFGYSKDAYLKSMAQYTGGKFYRAQSNEELVSIFRDIYMS